MTEYQVSRPLRRQPTHPGVLMREILDEQIRLPLAEVARRLSVSRPALYAVLNGEGAVTAEMALRFGKLAGAAPELYLHMQTNYDLWLAATRLRRDLARIETVAAPEAGETRRVAKRR